MASNKRHLILRLAQNQQDLVASQRLRYRVFVQELGAEGPTVDHTNRLECDDFDAFYDHLLLIDAARDPADLNHVIGVYRLLRSQIALANAGFYTATEFDLMPLLSTGRNLLELGRSCVDREFRGGIAMYHLWNGLADYVLRNDVAVLFGVASYHSTDVSRIAQSLSYLHRYHLAPECLRVCAKAAHFQPLDLVAPPDIDRKIALKQTPPLIKAYLRLGGTIGNGAFVDQDFNTVDICLMMDTAAMSRRHKENYTKRQSAGVL